MDRFVNIRLMRKLVWSSAKLLTYANIWQKSSFTQNSHQACLTSSLFFYGRWRFLCFYQNFCKNDVLYGYVIYLLSSTYIWTWLSCMVLMEKEIFHYVFWMEIPINISKSVYLLFSLNKWRLNLELSHFCFLLWLHFFLC